MSDDIATLLRRCRSLGAELTPVGGQLKVRAPSPLSDELIAALKELKAQVITELGNEHESRFHCWVLEEWRRVSIPSWRRILKESIEQGNNTREEYARWMLGEVLEDEEYKEGKE